MRKAPGSLVGEDRERGAAAVEYAIIAALVAAVVAGTAGMLGLAVDAIFGDPTILDALG